VPVPDARRGRPEPDRPRAWPRARHHPDRGAARRAPARWRATVLHARIRLRLLKDVVAVIRRFKPQIIIAVFSGTPADGHGHHQVSAILARQAFDLLRDSAGGPQKFYRSTRGDPTATTLTLPVGTLDPIVGQSYFQIAMASRSRHRSQDMGQLQRLGPATSGVALLATKPGAGSREPGAGNNGESSMFTGVDTTIHVTGYAALIDSARGALTPWRPA